MERSVIHSAFSPFQISRAAERVRRCRRNGGRWLRCSTQQVTASPSSEDNRGPSAPNSRAWAPTPGGLPRPAGPQNISRCKWPNRETRRESRSQSGAADSGFPPPFVPPPKRKSHRPSVSPSHPAPALGRRLRSFHPQGVEVE